MIPPGHRITLLFMAVTLFGLPLLWGLFELLTLFWLRDAYRVPTISEAVWWVHDNAPEFVAVTIAFTFLFLGWLGGHFFGRRPY